MEQARFSRRRGDHFRSSNASSPIQVMRETKLQAHHVSEIGGSVPGSFASEATEIFQEGLRVPPVKIKRRGEDNDDVWKLLLANVRTPRENYGDYRALIAAIDLGERRLGEIIRKYGKETFQHCCEDLLDYSEKRMTR